MRTAPLLLVTVLQLVGATVYHAYPDVPHDLCACVKAAKTPGDECRVHAGRHFVGAARCFVNNARGTPERPIVVAAAGDGPVVVDGTVAVNGSFAKTAGGHYAAPSGGLQILQLFVDGELQVLARYPNALWSDKGVYMAVKRWFRSTAQPVPPQPAPQHNLSTGVGLLRDAGACDRPGASSIPLRSC